MSIIGDRIRQEIDGLQDKLVKSPRHGCRMCMWYACGGTGKCHCGCGQVGKERRLHLDALRSLAECVDTGEVPPEPSGDSAVVGEEKEPQLGDTPLD